MFNRHSCIQRKTNVAILQEEKDYENLENLGVIFVLMPPTEHPLYYEIGKGHTTQGCMHSRHTAPGAEKPCKMKILYIRRPFPEQRGQTRRVHVPSIV